MNLKKSRRVSKEISKTKITMIGEKHEPKWSKLFMKILLEDDSIREFIIPMIETIEMMEKEQMNDKEHKSKQTNMSIRRARELCAIDLSTFCWMLLFCVATLCRVLLFLSFLGMHLSWASLLFIFLWDSVPKWRFELCVLNFVLHCVCEYACVCACVRMYVSTV